VQLETSPVGDNLYLDKIIPTVVDSHRRHHPGFLGYFEPNPSEANKGISGILRYVFPSQELFDILVMGNGQYLQIRQLKNYGKPVGFIGTRLQPYILNPNGDILGAILIPYEGEQLNSGTGALENWAFNPNNYVVVDNRNGRPSILTSRDPFELLRTY